MERIVSGCAYPETMSQETMSEAGYIRRRFVQEEECSKYIAHNKRIPEIRASLRK